MKSLTLIFILMLLLSAPVSAQDSDPFLVKSPTTPSAEGEIIEESQCFYIINRAPYMVFGDVATNYFTRPDGIKTNHKSIFRLNSGYKVEFCSSGPFYEGQKLELTLRTLIPIFSCKTAISGNIIIDGRTLPEGGTETWAECL